MTVNFNICFIPIVLFFFQIAFLFWNIVSEYGWWCLRLLLRFIIIIFLYYCLVIIYLLFVHSDEWLWLLKVFLVINFSFLLLLLKYWNQPENNIIIQWFRFSYKKRVIIEWTQKKKTPVKNYRTNNSTVTYLSNCKICSVEKNT